MVLPPPLLFAVVTGHIGVVTVLLMNSMLTLLKLKYRDVTAQEACAKLNILGSIAVLIHGCSALIVMFYGHWILLYFDSLILRWTVYEIVRNGNKSVYNAKTIMNPGEISKHIRNNYIRTAYFVMCLSICTQLVIKRLNNPIDWNVFNVPNMLFFISTICVTEVVLIILAYSIVALISIEQDSSCARDVCQNLNGLLLVKIIIHVILLCVLTAHTSWAFFISNLEIIHFEVCEREICLKVHDPEQILLPGQIYKHKIYYKTCFLYFYVCLGVYTYCMLVGYVGVLTYILLVLVDFKNITWIILLSYKGLKCANFNSFIVGTSTPLPMPLLEAYHVVNLEGECPIYCVFPFSLANLEIIWWIGCPLLYIFWNDLLILCTALIK